METIVTFSPCAAKPMELKRKSLLPKHAQKTCPLSLSKITNILSSRHSLLRSECLGMNLEMDLWKLLASSSSVHWLPVLRLEAIEAVV